MPPSNRPDGSALDDLAARVKRLGFPVYWLVDWAGPRRISNVLGKTAVSVLHTRQEQAQVWIEVETRFVGDEPSDPSAEASAALEEILWHELADIGHGAAKIVDTNAEILRQVAESPHRSIKIVVDQDGVDLLMVGDVQTWAAVGRKGTIGLRISSKGVEISAVALEQVDLTALQSS